MNAKTVTYESPGAPKMWRYVVPMVRDPAAPFYHAGWVDAVLREDGWFGCTSDYGNYAYRWTHFGDGDFREFFLELEPDYVCRKIGGRESHFDAEKTKALIKEHILQRRRYGGDLTKKQARAEWELLQEFSDPSVWHAETELFDASELLVYTHEPDAISFSKKTLPYLQHVIRESLKAEKDTAGWTVHVCDGDEHAVRLGAALTSLGQEVRTGLTNDGRVAIFSKTRAPLCPHKTYPGLCPECSDIR